MNYITTRNVIDAPSLHLICCDKEMLEALFESDAALAALLGINIPATWTEHGEPAFKWTYAKLSVGNANIQWWTYLPVLKSENMLVGSCGFKGDPDNGMVEIGYEVAGTYRGKGLATEIARTLIDFAFQHDEVKFVQAHTLAEKNESGSILKKCGMQRTGEVDDPDDGKLWRWEITR